MGDESHTLINANFQSSASNLNQFPRGLEIVSSTKTPSEEVFYANEVTITKKVRQTEPPQENDQSSSTNSYTQDTNPTWPQQTNEQQYSVLSKQHPSISQSGSGVSITKLSPIEPREQKKSKKSKEFNINKILSKLQPVPVSGSPTS